MNLKFYGLIEKLYSANQNTGNVAYPDILLPTQLSGASLKGPQNTSKNDDDGSAAPRQRQKNTWESRSRFQGGETGKLLGRRGEGRGGRVVLFLWFLLNSELFRLSGSLAPSELLGSDFRSVANSYSQ